MILVTVCITQALGHPIKFCCAFKDNLQALVDARALKLKPDHKTATANMSLCLQLASLPQSR